MTLVQVVDTFVNLDRMTHAKGELVTDANTGENALLLTLYFQGGDDSGDEVETYVAFTEERARQLYQLLQAKAIGRIDTEKDSLF